MKRTFIDSIKSHLVEVLLVGLALLVIHIFLLAETYRGDRLDATVAGQFGDFIGGYVGTIFLVVSVALLSGSYRNQRSTNERTSFESRFFELLRYHRENVAEVGIGEKTGRRVFVSLVREFREALRIVNEACSGSGLNYPRKQQIELAYISFYYGVGPNSSRVLSEAAGSRHPSSLVQQIIAMMASTQRHYRSGKREAEESVGGECGAFSPADQGSTALTRLSYCPFEGHQSRLGHYYRHLYQLVTYCRQHAPVVSTGEYMNLIGAQLTNHEQALLCLHALSPMGVGWIEHGYLDDFQLIKGIPRGFFDATSELDLLEHFPKVAFD